MLVDSVQEIDGLMCCSTNPAHRLQECSSKSISRAHAHAHGQTSDRKAARQTTKTREREDIPSNTISRAHAKRVKHRPIVPPPLAPLRLRLHPRHPALRRKLTRSHKIPRGVIRSILMHTHRRSLGYIPPVNDRAALWHDSWQRDRCRGVDA